jgi:hypothetical protein
MEASRKSGQVTVFIVLAIVVVGAIIAYFVLRDGVGYSMHEELKPVYDYYLACVEDVVDRGIDRLGSKGGYIEDPSFESGSLYAPQSSQLSFFGQAVPYWLYVSGNGIVKEQVPTRSQMAGQLEDFIERGIGECDFVSYEESGYDVYLDESVDAYVVIEEANVVVVVEQGVSLYKGDVSAYIVEHEFSVSSKLGRFYDLAIKTFEYEKARMFLEDYALDVMRLYAPVDGVDITCAPKVIDKNEVRGDIVDGLVANIGMLKLNGDYYDLREGDEGYFVVDELETDERVSFMYDSDWPTKIEIYGDDVIMPVGLQEGLGYLGFCYLPYHYVYDISFPVLVQFYDEEESFQFPVVSVISRNQARESVDVGRRVSVGSEMCGYANQEVKVMTYDMDLEPVEARISFECLEESCNIGSTDIGQGMQDVGDAVLTGHFPQCLNGYIVAQADGYASSKYLISTNVESVANIVMKKKYNLSLDLEDVDSALVSFQGESYSTNVFYPRSSSIELIEDYYNVTVYAYENSTLKFREVTRQECVDVATGALSLLGVTEEECYDVTIPAMDIDNVIVGGGKSVDYILDDELDGAVELNLEFPRFAVPSSLEELQTNYEMLEALEVYVSLN